MSTSPEAYNSLEAYKTKASELEKKVIKKPDFEEHQKLSAEIDLTLGKLERDMNTSEVLADSTVKQGFLNVQTQLTRIKEGIDTEEISSIEETPSIPSSQLETSVLPEDKSFWTKTKDWVKEQGTAVTSKEQRKEHPWANVARVAGGIGAGVLVYKGIK
jgi:hypothetical protein